MNEVETKSDIKTKTKTSYAVKRPPLFKVIYINDNETSMQFVVDSLINIFDYNENQAIVITEDIHNNGSSVVAVLPFEIAEQKGIEVTVDARGSGYPLQIKLEADE